MPARPATRTLGRTGLPVSRLGFGAVKIGRRAGLRYPADFQLPDDDQLERLLNGLLDLGITYLDTAPAYGLSEERLGKHLAHRRAEFTLSTKAGEHFDEDAGSSFDFSRAGVIASVERSLRRLRTDAVDIVYLHSDGHDLALQRGSDAVEALRHLRQQGKTRAIGLSGKTPEGARAALEWADVLMVPFHRDDRSHEAAMREAHDRGVGVVVKKGLGSGHLPAADALRFLAGVEAVDSVVVGSLNLDHLRANAALLA